MAAVSVSVSCRAWRSARRWSALALVLVLATLARTARAEDPEVLVFAAASLTDVLNDINGQWRDASGQPAAKISFAASSALARQIEQGAPADLFVSADLEWMDYLDQRKRIRADARANLVSNTLVLIAPQDSKVELALAKGAPLVKALGGGRLAMADAAVPAGKYGKAALESLGLWASVQGRLAPAENVRAALLLVSRGEAPLGIVYGTDARADAGVRVVDTFAQETHPPIVYPAALTERSQSAAAKDLLTFLRSEAARATFEKYGFTRPVR